jgi:hypothetical protein
MQTTTYGELNFGQYYLLQVDAESDIEVVSVLLQTKETVLLRSWIPQAEDFFKYSDEPIFKMVEQMDAETATQFEAIYAQPEETELDEFEEE